MSMNIPTIGDIVISPHEKFKDEDGIEVYDQLLTDGGVVIEVDRPILYDKLPYESTINYLNVYTPSMYEESGAAVSNPDNLGDGDYVTFTEVGSTASTSVRRLVLELSEVVEVQYLTVVMYYLSSRTYYETKFEISLDSNTWIVVFDSETEGDWVSTVDGKVVDVSGQSFKYIRLSANGSTSNGSNHYVEVFLGTNSDNKFLPTMTSPSTTPYRIVADLT